MEQECNDPRDEQKQQGPGDKSVAFNSSHGMSIYSWDNMFSSRSDQGIEPKHFSQIKFNFQFGLTVWWGTTVRSYSLLRDNCKILQFFSEHLQFF